MSDAPNTHTAPTEAVDLIHFVNAVAESTPPTPASNNAQQTGKESLSESRAKGARMIVPGFSMPNNNPKNVLWPPGTPNPTLLELRKEMLVRNPTSKPNYYDKAKCIDILLKVPYLPPSGNRDEEHQNEAPAMFKMKHSKVWDAPRLINVLIHLKHQYLLRDAKLTRLQIDNKESNDSW